MYSFRSICLSFWIMVLAASAWAELSELEYESPLENHCELADGVYEAQTANGNRVHLVLESKKIVSMYVLVNSRAPIVAMFAEWIYPAEYEAIHLKRQLAGCHGNHWFYVWKQEKSPALPANAEPVAQITDESTEGEQDSDLALFEAGATSSALAPLSKKTDLEFLSNQNINKKTYFKTHAGIVEGEISEDKTMLILNRVRAMNNFTAMLGAIAEERRLEFTHHADETAASRWNEETEEMESSRTMELARRQCKVPAGAYRFVSGHMGDSWDYTLRLGEHTGLLRVWDSYINYQSHDYSDIRVVCDGDIVLIDFPNQDRIEFVEQKGWIMGKNFNPREIFVGRYDPVKDTIDSLSGRILLSQPERLINPAQCIRID